MKKTLLIIPFLFVSLFVEAQKFPLTTSVRWGEVQKVKTLGHSAYLKQEDGKINLNFLYAGIRDSKGYMAEILNVFEVDTNSLSLEFKTEDREYHNNQGTENFMVSYYIPNYMEAQRSGSALVKDVEMKIEYKVTSRADKTKSITLNDLGGSTYSYFEVDNALFFLIHDSTGLKIKEFDIAGNTKDYFFTSDILFKNHFEVLSMTLSDGGSRENLRICYVIAYRENESEKVCVLQLGLNLSDNSVSSSQYEIQSDGEKLPDNLISCDIYYINEQNGKIDNIALKVSMLVTSGAGTSSYSYIRHSPLYIMKNNNGVLEQKHAVKSASTMGNYSSISSLNEFKDGYLYIGSGFSNHYSSQKNVDFSETGDKGSIPHLILDYISNDGTEYYKTLSVSGVKNLFASCIYVSPASNQSYFKAYAVVYCGSIGRVSKARVAEITLK